MKRIKFLHIIWALFYLAIFFILLNNSFSYMDPDLGWHLRVGEQVLADKAVPNLELYNYTLEGEAWVDHEWLLNAATYWIYENYGYPALNIFFALLIVIALIILNVLTQKYALKKKNGFIFIIIFQTLGVIASLPHLGVRMQEITLLNVAILLFIIYHYEKNHSWKILFWLLPLFYLWASMHGGFLIGIFILFFWALIKLIEILLLKLKYHSSVASPSKYKKFCVKLCQQSAEFIDGEKTITVKQIFIFLFFVICGAVAATATPYGVKLYSYLLNITNSSFMMEKIVEWFPFYYLPIKYWQLLYFSFIVIVILLIFFYACKKRKELKAPLWEMAVAIFFLALALRSKRHFPILFIVSFPLLIGFFSSFFSLPNDNFLNKKWPKQFFIVKPYIAIAFIVIIASKLIGINFITDPFIFFGGKYPRDAAAFLKGNSEYSNKKLFAKYGWGGYLIWVMPEKKLFIDGRLPQYPFAGHTLLEEYYEFFNETKIEDKLKQYDIGLVLMPSKISYYKLNWFEKYFLLLNEEKINEYENHFKNYLEQSDNWKLIYNDKISDIYVKE